MIKEHSKYTHRARTRPASIALSKSKLSDQQKRRTLWVSAAVVATAVALTALSFNAKAADAVHGVAISGDLKYPADFPHFDYVNPDAPKGGKVTQSTTGTYDSLNAFILKGSPVVGTGLIYDTLTEQSLDEPFSEYGVIAESVEIPDDKRWVIFNLRKEARWHDGVALTADDVVFSFDIIKSEGHPFYKSYYGKVSTAEALDSHKVKFSFSEGNNAELPMIMGQLVILPKHFWEGREFGKSSLDPLLGSGPYKFGKIDAGRSITYELVDDYWGKDLPVNKGRHNFAEIKYDYYKDATVALEAMKAGNIDFRQENISKNWATAYESPALEDGRLVKELIEDNNTQPMQGFILNNRRAPLDDIRVRRALGLAFDFEWMNKNLFYGAYTRTKSYFQNSIFQATGLPEGAELEILEPYRDQLRPEVFDTEFTVPQTDGSGNLRKQYREALVLLRDAGWSIKNGKLTNGETGKVMEFEFMIASPSSERIGLAYKKTLERLGIELKVRQVDSAQYQKRIEERDFDMILTGWAQSQSPGNEQYDYWGTDSASEPGSRNYAGISDPVIDELIDKLVSVPDRESLIPLVKALDRVLLHNHYVVPTWHIPYYRVAYWNKFDRPETKPTFSLGFDTWWIDPEKEAALDQ